MSCCHRPSSTELPFGSMVSMDHMIDHLTKKYVLYSSDMQRRGYASSSDEHIERHSIGHACIAWDTRM